MGRVILHSDMNAFYASVEQMLDPSLRDRAIAVCGSKETRHGIVLAKSQQAKVAGVKTGMAIWEAKECCPGLTVVPPQYGQYAKYSRYAHEIYLRYTNQVEPFGMDECWLDITGREQAPEKTADEIRRTVREELGLTVSVGVSFNKIFAKLGSDLKKPDAVTVIGREDFREKIWPLPAGDLLYCGPATSRKLARYGVHTIGDIAATGPETMRCWFGINGVALWRYAAGLDTSRVMDYRWKSPIKSVGHGVTCVSDLEDDGEVWLVMLDLAQDVGHRLRLAGLKACGVQVSRRDADLSYRQYQAPLPVPTRSPGEIAARCFEVYRANRGPRDRGKVRALCVRAIRLVPEDTPRQLSLFDDEARREKREKLDDAVEEIRRRFGEDAIRNASLLGDHKVCEIGANKMRMPGMMFQ